MNVIRSIHVAIVVMMLTSNLHAEDLQSLQMPEFDVMNGMKTAWVAEKMVYNGHPMSIQNFSSNRKAADVMRYFASRWKIKGHGVLKHNRVGEDMTIGYEHAGYSYSVQVRDRAGGSDGSLVVTRNREYSQGPVKFPLHPEAELLARIHSFDMGTRSETLTLSYRYSAVVHKEWYRSTLLHKGWTAQESLPSPDDGVIAFQKGRAQCQLSFTDRSPVPDHRSIVMIHWIKG